MKITIVGDFVPQRRVLDFIEKEDESFISEKILKEIRDSDFSVVNLEAPIVLNGAKPIQKPGPNLKCSFKTARVLNKIGFDIVTLANNHFYDYGQQGVNDTIEQLKNNKIDFVGGGRDFKESSQIKYKENIDVKISFVNICENEFSISTKDHGGSNPIDLTENYYQIQEAKKKSDFVILIVHGGHERYQLPSPRMKKLYQFYIDIGADIVINHHQHCYSGYQEYNGKYIFYGLGNFCFDKGKADGSWNHGFMLKLDINKESFSYQLIPYVQCAEYAKIEKNHNEISFYSEIKRLNSIINNDLLLYNSFISFVKSKKHLLDMFEPFQSKYFKSLRYRKLFPFFFKRKSKIRLENFIKCESHRDVLLNYLRENLKKYE